MKELGKPDLMRQWKEILQTATKPSHDDGHDGSDSDDSHDEPSLQPETHETVVALFAREGLDFERLCEETLGT